jgi:alpha-L-rhamnosidase
MHLLKRITWPMPVVVSVLMVAGFAGPSSGALAATTAASHSLQADALDHPLAGDTAGLSAGSLTAEHLTDPLGIDTGHPQLGWVITSSGRGVVQTAYQIQVAQSPAALQGGSLVWDSGKVASARSFDVSYGGPALQSTTRYYWQVRVWDNGGGVSQWSQPAWFETAFLNPGQFQASWIGQYPDSQAQNAAPGELLFRKQFGLTGQIARARLYVSGLSYPYIYINGRAVSDHMQDTAFTTFNKTVDYNTYDVTGLLQQATNAVAVSLGHGFYAGGADDYPGSGEPWQPAQPKLKLQLEVWYTDGHSAQVSSDGSWKLSTGPTTADSPAVESYDARLEKPGWTQAGYGDSNWSSASVVSAPAGVMRAQLIPPVLQTSTVKPVKVTDLAGETLPVPSYSATPPANWLWNVAGASNIAPEGTIYLRKTFTVADPSSISSAVLRVNGDDGDMAYVNGTLVSSAPGNVVNGWQTSQISDIKSLLVPGTNVIALAGISQTPTPSGVIAAAQLDSTRIVTDGTWKALPGTPASPPAGWNTAGFDDSSWPAANVQAPYGSGPWGTGVQTPPGPSKVYDFGITTSGWARVTMQGAAGTQVQIKYSEKLNPNGTVESEGGGSQTDTYILKGGGPETYQPKYGWKGYRYVQVSVAPGGTLPDIQSVTGVIAHTALASAGDFTSSGDLLNSMHAAMRNTILNNQYSYGSDTPTYEKGGWTNDNGDYATSEMANFDAEAYYTHMMQNFDDSQDPAGDVGWLVPDPPGDDVADPLWGGSYLLIENDMFQSYDDLATISRDYSHMAAYMDYMKNQIAPNGYIYMGRTWGDWSVPGNATPPSSEMIGTMFLYREAKDLATMAAAIGNSAGATMYNQLAGTIETAVNNKFYDPAHHQYYDPPGTNSDAAGGPSGPTGCTPGSSGCGYDQTANVFGLAFGLAPAQDRQAIANGLAADVVAKGNHLATGANGSKYILPMLTAAGYGDLAYKVATNPTAPGWGQWFLQCGATTMWENWEDSSCNSARSRDHAFMGTVDDWLFSGVAGIQPASPGFQAIQIKPSSPQGSLTSASASQTTPYGQVSSSWASTGSAYHLTVHVPVGAHATVFVPASSAQSVTESDQPVGQATGVHVTGMQGGYLQVQVGSGTYRFVSVMS